MSRVVLYHTPGACSRLTLSALEEIGLMYEDQVVNIFSGEQRSPTYLAINPKGKVVVRPSVVSHRRVPLLELFHSRQRRHGPEPVNACPACRAGSPAALIHPGSGA